MSTNFKLGIFDQLGEYLNAAITQCPSGVDGCRNPSDVYDKYYLQKYQPKSSAYGVRDEYVAAAFTNAVVAVGQNLRKFDVSTGASLSIESLLADGIRNYFSKVTTAQTGTKTIDDIVAEVAKFYDKNAAKKGTTEIEKLKISTTELQTAMLAAVKGKLTAENLDSTTKCLAGTGVTSICKTTAFPDVTIPDETVGTSGDIAAVFNEIKGKFEAAAFTALKAWVSATYEKPKLTGADSNVATVLKTLKSGVSEAELRVFNALFNIRRDTPAGEIDGSVSDITDANISNFRLNLLKNDINIGGSVKTVPKLALYLPLLQTQNKVMYNTNDIADVPDETVLRNVFYTAYSFDSTKYVGEVAKVLPRFDGKGPTRLHPDLEAIMRDILSKPMTRSAHIADDDTEAIDAALKGIWKRVGEDTWKHTLPDGTVVAVIKPGTAEFDAEVTKEVTNCSAVGFGNDVVKCKDFLTAIASNTNPTELAKIASSMTEEVAAKVVADLHPKYALAILKAFGFRRKLCKDKVAGRQIEKVQRKDEWLKSFIDKKFTDANAVTSIKGNEKLLNFLDLLAQLVNGNPSILNDSYAGETEESTGEVVVPDELSRRKIVAAQSRSKGQPFMSWNQITDNMNKVYGSFSRGLTFDGASTNSPFGLDNLFPSVVLPTATHVVRGSTWGGSMVGGADNIKAILAEHPTAIEYSRNISNIFSELLENLRASGKTLSDRDTETLTKKVRDFVRIEGELFQTAQNIQLYAQLIKILEAEKRSEIITESHIKNYVEKYNHLLGKYEKTGNSFNTLISLLKDCNEDGGKGCSDAEL